TWLVKDTLDDQPGPLAAASPGTAAPTASPAPVSRATMTIGNRKWYMAGPSRSNHSNTTPADRGTEEHMILKKSTYCHNRLRRYKLGDRDNQAERTRTHGSFPR